MGMHKYETIVRLADADALLERLEGRPLWAVEKDHARRSVDGGRARSPRGWSFSSEASASGFPRRS